MQVRDLIVNNSIVKGIEIPLPNAVLVMVSAPKGYLMCGYLNLAAAEKMGDCAAIIRGVKTVDDLLEGKVAEATTFALKSGIAIGMTGREALTKLI